MSNLLKFFHVDNACSKSWGLYFGCSFLQGVATVCELFWKLFYNSCASWRSLDSNLQPRDLQDCGADRQVTAAPAQQHSWEVISHPCMQNKSQSTHTFSTCAYPPLFQFYKPPPWCGPICAAEPPVCSRAAAEPKGWWSPASTHAGAGPDCVGGKSWCWWPLSCRTTCERVQVDGGAMMGQTEKWKTNWCELLKK